MNLPRIVCPYDKSLLKGLTGYTVTLRMNNPSHAAKAAAEVRRSGNTLFCIILETNSPLDKIDLREDLKDIPLAIMSPSLGKFRNLARHLNKFRDFNLRVYLPCDNPQNFAGLRILSSVNIHSCAVFGNGEMDWETLTDLMTYAILERTLHAPIEPFAFIASHYDPFSYFKWGFIHFDDPERFLHLDAKGHVALSRSELIKKRFIARSVSEIEAADEVPAIRERAEAWRRYFVDNHPCASCEGWKICLGKFSAHPAENKGCAAFFKEMIEVARQYKAQDLKGEECRIWQP